VQISWFPSLEPGEQPPTLGGQRMARLRKLVAHFARLHHRRPLHGTLIHDNGRVIAVQLEDETVVTDITTPNSIHQLNKKAVVTGNGLERKTRQ
jgi:hypothetical protein